MIFGIDLGTTNSLIGLSESGQSRVFSIEGSNLIPSVVAFDETGEVLAVGRRAQALKLQDPKNVVFSVKRLMGKGIEDLSPTEVLYDLSASTREKVRLTFGNRTYTPEEVSALILKKCVAAAEAQLGKPVKEVVITVPAYFNEAERSATALAGKLAGLTVRRIINEPTAAALAYGIRQSSGSQIIAVYDFGGGTFDISILKLTGEIFEVLSTHGDTKLGGDDLDRAVYDWLLQQGKVPKPETREDEVLLLSQCEQIKRALSDQEKIQVRIQFAGKLQWEGTIFRSEWEAIWAPILERTLKSCALALSDAKLQPEQVDQVLMVGGSTRLPLCRKMVGDFFQKTPNTSLNPDEVVALGAAVQGEILSEEAGGALAQTLLLDVVPLSLGIETMGGLVSKIIHRNSTIPCSAQEFFTTSVDQQTAVDIHVLQGEREFVKDCRSLGRFKLKVPPMAAGIPKVNVTFLMDANGMLKVQAREERTNSEASIELKPSYGLTDQEIEQMLLSAFSHAEQDVSERQRVEALQSAKSLIRLVEKSLDHPLLPHQFRREEQEKLTPILKALRADLDFADSAVIHMRTKELELASHQLAEKIVTLSLQAHVSV